MYWNSVCGFTRIDKERDKLQHEMYWNNSQKMYNIPWFPINYNMRCIETKHSIWKHNRIRTDKLQHEMYWNEYKNVRLFVDREDKLQHEMYWNSQRGRVEQRLLLINYNMRCIETFPQPHFEKQGNSINYNMRCIETILPYIM